MSSNGLSGTIFRVISAPQQSLAACCFCLPPRTSTFATIASATIVATSALVAAAGWVSAPLAVLGSGLALWVLERRSAFVQQRDIDRANHLATLEAGLQSELRDARKRAAQIEQARLQFIEYSDHVLRRVGAELHDGPAQLIGISLLRLDAGQADTGQADSVPAGAQVSDDAADFAKSNAAVVRQALTDALSDIRNLSQGLILPEIDKLTLEEAARLAVSKHEQRTGTSVELNLSKLPGTTPQWLKRYVYRFAQEGLMNAFRHAGGVGQAVDVTDVGGALEVKVSDRGPGIMSQPDNFQSGRTSLGLAGLRERAGAIGAVIDIQSVPGTGTCMKTQIPFSALRESCGVPEV